MFWEESMNIFKIKIKNYKSIKDSGEVAIDDKIMAFIGQNNAGNQQFLTQFMRISVDEKAVNRSDFQRTHDNIEICFGLMGDR